jgi:HSP20 family protein
MLLTRFNPLSPGWLNQMQQLQSEMNRLFDRWGDSRFPAETAPFPAINVWEDEHAFTAEAELPGLDLKDVEIYITGQNQLTIKGERKLPGPGAANAAGGPNKSVQHRQERGFGKFVRSLTLPSPVDENQIEARLENGVLTMRLPKHERAKPRKIAIKA